MNIDIKKLAKSQVELSGEITAEQFATYRAKALEIIGKDVELDGFRKGKVPTSVLESKVQPSAILEEMAELAMSEAYTKILEENKIDAIGRPEIMITKLAQDNPLGFKITTAVMPEVKLGDYKKAAKENKMEVAGEVTDKEVEDAILEVRRMRQHNEFHKNDKPGEHAPHDALKDEDLPELNNEYVQGFGPFKTVDEFKAKMKENIGLEKAQQAQSKSRAQLVEELVKTSEIDVPQVIIDSEIDKTIYKVKTDIEQAGMKYEDYLKHLNKTEDDIKREIASDAEKRAKLELILHAISVKENLKPDEKEVETQVGHLVEHYKGADPIRARVYIESIMTNELVFKFLEEQK